MSVGYSNKISNSLRNAIDESYNYPNMLKQIDSIFSLPSEDVTFLVVMPDLAVIVITKREETVPMTSPDSIPLLGLTRYKLEKVTGTVELIAFDKELTYDIKYQITGDSNKLRKKIISEMNSLDFKMDDVDTPAPIFCSAEVNNGFCDIIGVYPMGDASYQNDDEVPVIMDAVNLVSNVLHETVSNKSKNKIIAYSSIVDRIYGEKLSIPEIFLRKKGGALEHPFLLAFSEKIEHELGLAKNTEICLFRDEHYLLISIYSETYGRTFLSRIKFSDLINSNNRIDNSKISTALSKGLSLKRDKSGISTSSIKRKMAADKDSKFEELYTRVGIGLKYASLNIYFTKGGKGNGLFKSQQYNENAAHLHNIIPLILHLCLARFDPQYKKEMRVRNSKGKDIISRNKSKKRMKILDWGVDRIRYVSHKNSEFSRSKHWVSPHLRTIELSSKKTIQEYEKLGRPMFLDGKSQFGMRMIRGHYRGIGEVNEWSGDFRFGKPPNHYSQKAIRWLTHIENENEISIQHAEKGGELRINTGGRYIWVDGYCKENNTIYEFHGDLYHGNPRVFSENDFCNPKDKTITAGELYRKTINREEEIRSLGYNLVVMWELDWDEIEHD